MIQPNLQFIYNYLDHCFLIYNQNLHRGENSWVSFSLYSKLLIQDLINVTDILHTGKSVPSLCINILSSGTSFLMWNTQSQWSFPTESDIYQLVDLCPLQILLLLVFLFQIIFNHPYICYPESSNPMLLFLLSAQICRVSNSVNFTSFSWFQDIYFFLISAKHLISWYSFGSKCMQYSLITNIYIPGLYFL